MDIFVSSTSKDLAEHRAAVIEEIRQSNHRPVAMETFGSRAGDAQQVSLEAVQEADLFIGIYAHRYGYRPDGYKSVTEMEYLEARQAKIDRLIFLVSEDYSHPLIQAHAETDPEAIQYLKNFKERLLRENVRAEFTTPENLALKVLRAIQNWLNERVKEADNTPAKPGPSIKYNFGNVGNQTIIDNISGGNQYFGNSATSDKDDDDN